MTKQPPDQGWKDFVLNSLLPKMEATSTEQATGFTPAPAQTQPLSFAAPHIAPSFDVIELLPTAAAEKLRLLRDRRSDAYATTIPHF